MFHAIMIHKIKIFVNLFTFVGCQGVPGVLVRLPEHN